VVSKSWSWWHARRLQHTYSTHELSTMMPSHPPVISTRCCWLLLLVAAAATAASCCRLPTAHLLHGMLQQPGAMPAHRRELQGVAAHLHTNPPHTRSAHLHTPRACSGDRGPHLPQTVCDMHHTGNDEDVWGLCSISNGVHVTSAPEGVPTAGTAGTSEASAAGGAGAMSDQWLVGLGETDGQKDGQLDGRMRDSPGLTWRQQAAR
jgi:hypothetical protein